MIAEVEGDLQGYVWLGVRSPPPPRTVPRLLRNRARLPFPSSAARPPTRVCRPCSQVNLIAAALYHVYVKFIIGEMNLSTMDMVLYNNLMSIPLLVVLGLLLDK